VKFSGRLPRLSRNVVSRIAEEERTHHGRLIDLTDTNPTAVGLPYPSDLFNAFADPRALRYAPDPRGLLEARQAIAGSRPHLKTAASRLVLTASTSEAYSLLFKLLCDPGDEVLVPQPSYPLFDLLSRLDGVRPAPYTFAYHGHWSLDRPTVEAALTARTRAIVVVTPNNPTGSMLSRSDHEWLVEVAAGRQLAIISDEVFADYPLNPRSDASSLAGESRAMVFVLDGLSKSVGLPQAKLAWIAASGPAQDVDDVLVRMDVIADTYLSVSTPVQLATGRLLAEGRVVRAAIAERLVQNLAVLRAVVGEYPAVSLLEPEGGWSAVIRVPSVQSEEEMVIALLRDAHVLVHPGYFFDFPSEAFLVLSLLPEPATFREGVGRVLSRVGKVSV
jgi:aspartate/methionine/tyrosine aminotransferase